MMRKLVENFVHRPGIHCESSALRDIFEFYGFTFSESKIFGLGSGLGFIYWYGKQMPYPFVGGRARDLYKNLCNNLGVVVKVNKTSSKTKAYEALRKLIAEDVPVMIHVDMPFLKYLGLPKEAHFGGHVVVVAGIDENKGVVYVADTAFEKLQTATLKELEEARDSKFKPFPPENKWFTFDFSSELTSLEGDKDRHQQDRQNNVRTANKEPGNKRNSTFRQRDSEVAQRISTGKTSISTTL